MKEAAFGTDELDKAKARLGEVEDGIVAKQVQREMMQNLVDTLEGMMSGLPLRTGWR